MTRFDAPASSSSSQTSVFRAAGALCMARLSLVLAAFVPTVLALVGATLLLAIGVAVPAALRQAFVASPVLVFVAPAASRGDGEAIGKKLATLPDVVSATLRPKEDALATLVAAGLPAPTDGRNPLPDVWAVGLRGDGPLFMTEVVAARDAITAIPGVDRVRFDEAWAGGLDRSVDAWARFGIAAMAGGLVSFAAVVFAVHGLFGRALAGSPFGEVSVSPAMLLMIDVLVGLVSALAGYAICLVIVGRLVGIELSAMKPIVVAIGQSWVVGFVEVTGVALVLVFAGVLIGGTNSTRQSK